MKDFLDICHPHPAPPRLAEEARQGYATLPHQRGRDIWEGRALSFWSRLRIRARGGVLGEPGHRVADGGDQSGDAVGLADPAERAGGFGAGADGGIAMGGGEEGADAEPA